MNLIFRMFVLWMTSLFKARLPVEYPENILRLMVLPNDIDINLHMNNGRYLTICDLTRVDMFIRTGLATTMLREKWRPVISEHTMKYKRGLKLFQRYQVYMKVSHWDEKVFHMQHRFMVKGRVVAEGTSKGVIISKHGVVTPAEVMRHVHQHLS